MTHSYRAELAFSVVAFAAVLACCGGSADSVEEPSTSVTSTTEAITTTRAPSTTMSPLEARSGLWEGTTQFGTFAFTVSPDGTSLTDFDLVYEEGGFTFSVSPEGEVSVPIDETNAVDLQLGDTTFEIRFSEDGTSASGHLEFDIPLAGRFSEEWQLTR